MAAPVVAGVATTNDGLNATGHTANLPASIAAGDLLVIDIYLSGSRTITAGPTGFTLDATDVDSGSGSRIGRYYKIADGSEGSTVGGITFSGASEMIATAYRITGAPGSGSPFDAASVTQQYNTNTNSYSTPSITTVTADCLILRGLAYRVNGAPGSWASSTEDSDLNSSNTSGSSAHKSQAAIGASGTETFTSTGTSGKGAAIVSAIPPAAAGGGALAGSAAVVFGASAALATTATDDGVVNRQGERIDRRSLLRVVSQRGADAYDLTPYIEGLSWSSVNPGGDERATFTLSRKWFAGAPEISQGNTIYISSGFRRLWSGRIEENDRAVQNSERIGVVALGLGVRLRDQIFREVYIDRSLDNWKEPSLERRLDIGNRQTTYTFSPGRDDRTGLQGFEMAIQPPHPNATMERVYDAGLGAAVARLYIEKIDRTGSTVGSANVRSWTSDTGGDELISADIDASPTVDVGMDPAQQFIVIHLERTSNNPVPATVPDGVRYRGIIVFGNHSIEPLGDPPEGLPADDVIRDIVARVDGVEPRNVDDTRYLIEQLAFLDGATHEEAIQKANEMLGFDWGTWSDDSLMDPVSVGQFDFRDRQEEPSWFVLRSECDDIALNTEFSSVWSEVEVQYEDAAGTKHSTLQGRTVPDLAERNIMRKTKLGGGTLTEAGAQTLGDIFLALSGAGTPARGSLMLSGEIRHRSLGRASAFEMRADGSTIALPDILPARDVFSLSDNVDRRAVFPIKRVEVDASGAQPKATVSVDQTPDALSILESRLAFAASRTVG